MVVQFCLSHMLWTFFFTLADYSHHKWTLCFSSFHLCFSRAALSSHWSSLPAARVQTLQDQRTLSKEQCRPGLKWTGIRLVQCYRKGVYTTKGDSLKKTSVWHHWGCPRMQQHYLLGCTKCTCVLMDLHCRKHTWHNSFFVLFCLWV